MGKRGKNAFMSRVYLLLQTFFSIKKTAFLKTSSESFVFKITNGYVVLLLSLLKHRSFIVLDKCLLTL